MYNNKFKIDKSKLVDRMFKLRQIFPETPELENSKVTEISSWQERQQFKRDNEKRAA